MINKLKINKKSIMNLSKDSTKLSKEQQKQVAGGKPRTSEQTVWDNRSTWECCNQ
ncbi:hypothetical protein Q4489_17925 [Thalassotalea sp. 1_MG-2023]|uniref:hypothetical protein n=1 Tax=Thalassotalea sp. 1_MG-2023 TaxID=3062680 RepID=UPI0026E4423A|nr:hypothetical protein [Thalassotalea sp. 1_MG-2023]MDO6428885.1 hypothetical protein [Thalassotalea sp. 1_MG-2023]